MRKKPLERGGLYSFSPAGLLFHAFDNVFRCVGWLPRTRRPKPIQHRFYHPSWYTAFLFPLFTCARSSYQVRRPAGKDSFLAAGFEDSVSSAAHHGFGDSRRSQLGGLRTRTRVPQVATRRLNRWGTGPIAQFVRQSASRDTAEKK